MRNNVRIWSKTGLLFFFLLLTACKTSPPATSVAPQEHKTETVRVAMVQPTVQAVTHTLKAVGSFLAEDEVTISAEVDGRIAQIVVDEGYPLETGQIVLRLEQERPQLEVARAEAEVREARASMELQQVTLKRRAELLKEQLISQQAYDEVAAQAELTKARLERAEAILRLARKSFKDTTVVSPLNGIVTTRHVATGEYIKAGQALFTAVKTHPLKLLFTLPERFASHVRHDQHVTVKVKAYPDQEFAGHIYFINPQVDPQTRALQLKAVVDNRDGLLKPGFFADVQLLLGTNENAVVLPQEAVVLREDRALAYVVENGSVQERVVALGERFDGKVEILSGIQPQEFVVTSGNYLLQDGQAVTVANGDRRADAT
jgi:membrane fusion protein (multidrug efflux system)